MSEAFEEKRWGKMPLQPIVKKWLNECQGRFKLASFFMNSLGNRQLEADKPESHDQSYLDKGKLGGKVQSWRGSCYTIELQACMRILFSSSGNPIEN